MGFSITLVLVIITAIVSIAGFSKPQLVDDLIFYPPAIANRGQWWRFITHGFVHADPGHLIFNMIALYSFGESLEYYFSVDCVFGPFGKLVYLLLYFSGLFMASYPDYIKYKDNYHFKSLGASGAVSAVIFSSILFFPQTGVGVIFIPGVSIPGWLFGIIYLGVSAYLDKRGGGRVNHGAHFWGAAYGIVFTIAACLLFAHSFSLFDNFKEQLRSSSRDTPLYCK